tara:strand:- start:5523 stop:6122 length:600 start_codon:yes stop_codon:yes gene_type:complete
MAGSLIIMMSGAGILGIVAMCLSFLFLMLVVGDELANSDYRDYGADWPCHLSTAESDRVYNWTMVALFMWLLSQGAGFMKYSSYMREYFENNDHPRRLLNLAFVLAGQVYLAAVFVIACLFEWGLTCNNYLDTLSGSNFLWAAGGLWIAGVAAMHAMPGKMVTVKGEEYRGAIFRAEHLVGVVAPQTEKMTLLTGVRKP